MKRILKYVTLAIAGIIVGHMLVPTMLLAQTQPTPTQSSTWSGIKSLYAEPDATAPQRDQLQTEAYPQYCFALNVPWLCQYPPGDMYNTKNCGQACGAMLGGYYNNGAVNGNVITAENSYLARAFNDSRYLNPNGWYTNFYQNTGGRDELGLLLRNFHGLRYSVYFGHAPDDVVQEVAHGRPVIVGVMISGGRLVATNGVPHWALAVGWNGNVILNDPGSVSGHYRQLSVSDFDRTWATQGRVYVPVYR